LSYIALTAEVINNIRLNLPKYQMSELNMIDDNVLNIKLGSSGRSSIK
jgi:hypothetical protein